MRKHLVWSFAVVFLMALGVSFAQNQVDSPLPQNPLDTAAPESPAPQNSASETPALENPAPDFPSDLPIIQNAEGYNYDPTGRRDPFRPYGQSQTAAAPGIIEPSVPPEPLQLFEVTQLKLVGIIWDVKSPKAMIKDPGGKLHMIRKETKVGRNNGFVAAIREGEVIIIEPTVGENGMPSALTRVLNLTR